ncbi:MAG: selenium-dependent molybdenum cofactor biosynthesis protein YqeB [Candidatus Eisenbacteria bacterium]
MKLDGLVVVRGGGDLGTGVAHRLFVAGYRVVVLETEHPTVVRRSAAFAEAVTSGSASVEEVEARLANLADLESPEGRGVADRPDWVPVLVDPRGAAIAALHPDAVVDARMAKVNLGTARDDAPVTVGLGPGFTAGGDVDFVVETARGHSLGRVILEGTALPNTGVPGLVGGVGAARVIRAPASGSFVSARAIGDLVREGDVVGTVGGREARAAVAGLLRGLVAEGVELREGQKLGDVDPRGATVDHARISDKARSIGGAVLEALLRAGVFPGHAH